MRFTTTQIGDYIGAELCEACADAERAHVLDHEDFERAGPDEAPESTLIRPEYRKMRKGFVRG